ncbi:NAD(P)/FAD-dependent oxidoreductase [Nocardia otitidiscaviarum]|uniref:NAD(P)/FAD-dependent oxidoreductase n=1 Tax=Nocardia otitidiscaviarum TaxID=1823 RepID=UPI0004A7795C|nr:NAD(P)/FAD-dependent oxidoreductase [Nocardia otitidiscaviarum]MBF6133080.1 NAD(P)/FAD-dependent oxidoreductase [Nocardia otitidiscaviarum]MBF6486475.1 NAD(P)/FAD-dependent oxidoreductase [Nocardia otitidiscaviarum]
MSETNYDVLVIGGGAAGLSAALLLTRSRRRVAVVDAGAPRNAPAAHMHGFLSRDGMNPLDLLAAGRAEVAGYGGELIDDRVVAAERAPAADRTGRAAGRADTADHDGDRVEVPGFTVRLASGRTLRARRLLVASGLRDELPPLPGLLERWGRDVLHCPYCHGYEVADQPIGLLGAAESGPAARSVHLALALPQWSRDLVFFPHTFALSDADRARITARGVRIVDGKVSGITVADDALRAVELADGTAVARSALFVVADMIPDNTVLDALGCELTDSGFVRTDANGRTSVPGVFAAGNAADPRLQVISAAGAAAAVAIAVNTDLVEEDCAVR